MTETDTEQEDGGKDLITKFKIDTTDTGKTVARLWRARDRYPEHIVFNVAELADAGIHNWKDIEPGIEHPCRFWCIWQWADNTKSNGNRYKNVIALEPHQSNGFLNADLQSIIGELAAIKAMVAYLVDKAGGSNQSTKQQAVKVADPAQVAAPTRTVEIQSPEDLDAALFGTEPQADPPIDKHQEFQAAFDNACTLLGTDEANKLVAAIQETANGEGHKFLAQCLTAELSRRQRQNPKQFLWRWKVIDRLTTLLDMDPVKNGAAQIPESLTPGWQYILTYQQIVDAGKELRDTIDNTPPF